MLVMLIHLLPIRHLTSMEPLTLQDQTNASVIPVTHCLQMHVQYRPTNLYHYNNNLNELWSGTLSSKKSQISPPFSSFFSSSLGGSGGGIRGVLPLKIRRNTKSKFDQKQLMEMINNDDDVSEKFKYRVVMITTGSQRS